MRAFRKPPYRRVTNGQFSTPRDGRTFRWVEKGLIPGITAVATFAGTMLVIYGLFFSDFAQSVEAELRSENANLNQQSAELRAERGKLASEIESLRDQEQSVRREVEASKTELVRLRNDRNSRLVQDLLEISLPPIFAAVREVHQFNMALLACNAVEQALRDHERWVAEMTALKGQKPTQPEPRLKVGQSYVREEYRRLEALDKADYDAYLKAWTEWNKNTNDREAQNPLRSSNFPKAAIPLFSALGTTGLEAILAKDDGVSVYRDLLKEMDRRASLVGRDPLTVEKIVLVGLGIQKPSIVDLDFLSAGEQDKESRRSVRLGPPTFEPEFASLAPDLQSLFSERLAKEIASKPSLRRDIVTRAGRTTPPAELQRAVEKANGDLEQAIKDVVEIQIGLSVMGSWLPANSRGR